MLANARTTLSGYINYQSQGKIIFLLHRLTGLGTLLFLCIHIVDTAVVYFAPALYADAINIYRTTPMMLGEIGLVFCVIFHGVNGLRISYLDLFKPQGWGAADAGRTMLATLVLSILLWLPAAGIMSYNILKFNFGMFGG